MKRLQKALAFFGALVLMLGAVANGAEDNNIKSMIGTFEGMAFNGDGLYPVKTRFTMEIGNRLSGSYDLAGQNQSFHGHLSNFMFEGPRTITMQWTDKDGEGFATMEFSSDFKSFTGGWTDKRGEDPLPWTGKKINDY
ncbi:MAG: hypothetical protein WCI66_08800 [Gammaproteobacteria bacterium]|jgi:hypothetical protein